MSNVELDNLCKLVVESDNVFQNSYWHYIRGNDFVKETLHLDFLCYIRAGWI